MTILSKRGKWRWGLGGGGGGGGVGGLTRVLVGMQPPTPTVSQVHYNYVHPIQYSRNYESHVSPSYRQALSWGPVLWKAHTHTSLLVIVARSIFTIISESMQTVELFTGPRQGWINRLGSGMGCTNNALAFFCHFCRDHQKMSKRFCSGIGKGHKLDGGGVISLFSVSIPARQCWTLLILHISGKKKIKIKKSANCIR